MPFDQADFQIEVSPVVRVLREARALIDEPQKWCKFSLYKSNQRCALGALYACSERDQWGDQADSPERSGAYDLLFSACGGSIASFNNADTTTHADVLALFDRAIEAAS